MTLSPLVRFWKLINQYKQKIKLIYYYAIISGLVNLSLPLGIQAIINYLQTGELTTSWVVLVVFVLVGITFSGAIQISQLKIVEDIQQDIFTKSAFEFVYRIPKIKQSKLNQEFPPELVNRFFDVLTIQKGLPKILIDFSLAVFQIIFGLILLTIYSPYFIILGVSLFLIIYLIFKITAPKGMETSIYESKHKYKLAHWIEDIATDSKTFKMYNDVNYHLNKTDEINTKYLKARKDHFKILITQFKLFIGFKVWVAAGLLVLGGYLVFNQQMNIGQFVASEIIIILIINSVEKITRIIETIYDVLTALDKIGYITDLEMDEHEGKATIAKENGIEIDVRNIDFTYEGNENSAIDRFSCKIAASSKVLLTGKTGKGKTTLMLLLGRFYNVNKGDIHYNQRPAIYYDLNHFNQQIGLITSTTRLFEATIEDNILLGRKIENKVLNDLLKVLQLKEQISQLKNGTKTLVSSEGRRLPKSIVQKIILARTLIHQPGLLLLEDPLSFIDEEEKKAIIDYIMDPNKSWTVVVVADYPYWKEKCNQIIEL